MANPPKQKGTKFETEVVNAALDKGLTAQRTSAGRRYDIDILGSTGRTIEALATRPDYGHTLVTMRLADFLHLLAGHGDGAKVECKRYRRFSLHGIFDDKFGA